MEDDFVLTHSCILYATRHALSRAITSDHKVILSTQDTRAHTATRKAHVQVGLLFAPGCYRLRTLFGLKSENVLGS